MKGKILSTVAGVYNVILEDKNIINITPRGKFRHLKIKPVVGDNVIIENNMISQILPRKNILIRPSIANIDLGIIVSSCEEPKYSSYLLDKFLSYLNMNNITPLIILSKIDLSNEEFINKVVEEYNKINIKVIPFSKKDKTNIDLIHSLIKNKTIAFMGQTGVGKSSLINTICPDFLRKEGEYSTSLKRGKHQTKEVIILPLEETMVADTPGFSSLELTCYKEELKDYFPFFKIKEGECFYQDCLHINEPKCYIKHLVEENVIPLEHYQNYKQIFNELIFRKDRYK